jgi:hypothetical protein
VRVLVAHLTDEELDVLTDGADDVVLRPHLDTLPPPERAAARRAAERSLGARGWLEPTGSEPTTVAVADALGSVLQVRRGAPEVTVLHRWTGQVSCTRYLFVLDPVVVCEDLTDQGVHTLSVAGSTDRDALVEEFLVPPDAVAAPVEPVRVLPAGVPPAELLAALGHPTVLAEVLTVRAGGPQHRRPSSDRDAVVLALGPTGCYHAERGGDGGWTVRPTTPEGVVDQVGRT